MWFEEAQQYRAGLICSVVFPRVLLLLVTTRQLLLRVCAAEVVSSSNESRQGLFF